MPSLSTLVQIASMGGFIVGGTGYIFHFLHQKQIRGTKIYEKALEIVHNHKKTITHLGKPIKEGRIKISEIEYNIRRLLVNLHGAKTKGILDCEVLFTEPNGQPEITKLEIKFADIPNKVFVLYENQFQ